MSDDVELDTDDDFEEEPVAVLSDKRQSEVDLEARRRLEKKLEEKRALMKVKRITSSCH